MRVGSKEVLNSRAREVRLAKLCIQIYVKGTQSVVLHFNTMLERNVRFK